MGETSGQLDPLFEDIFRAIRAPGLTPLETVRYRSDSATCEGPNAAELSIDVAEAMRRLREGAEGALRLQLIALGWTPPGCYPPAPGGPRCVAVGVGDLNYLLDVLEDSAADGQTLTDVARQMLASYRDLCRPPREGA